MNKNAKGISAFLYSSVGVAGMAVMLIAINIIVGEIFLRKDFTADQLYTLSTGSKQIVRDLTSPVTIRFYFTRTDVEIPVETKNFARRVEDLLQEYAVIAGGKIHIEKINPVPDSDAEDAATLDGIQSRPLDRFGLSGDSFYLGMTIECIDQKVTIPTLDGARENTLEYEITRAINRVQHPEKKSIGIMSWLPVMGEQPNPMMGMMGQPTPSWMFVSELKKDYTVTEVDKAAASIPDGVNVLLVVHPQNIEPKTEYAIDQFVLGGGKVIVFVDPLDFHQAQQQQNPMQPNPGGGPSTLDRLFISWGIDYDESKILADMRFVEPIPTNRGRVLWPGFLSLGQPAMNAEDVAASNLSRVQMWFSGALTGDAPEGLERSVLMHSSLEAQLVEAFKARMGPDAINKEFKSDDKEYALAVRLTGKFKTAFPDGPPADDGNDEGGGTDGAPLTESSGDPAVIVLADCDMLYDNTWVQQHPLFGTIVAADNNNLLQNVVEQLSGDSRLIGIRSRTVNHRPFQVIIDKQIEAEKRFKEKINDLEQELAETSQKINTLMRPEQVKDQQFVLSPEQERELEKFKKKRVEARRQIKDLRKQLRADIESIENVVMWANIAVVPLLLIILGMGLNMLAKRRNLSR